MYLSCDCFDYRLNEVLESTILFYKHSFYWENVDWIRIGTFSLESSAAILTEKLISPPNRKILQGKNFEEMLKSQGFCVLTNIKTGIWIAGIRN